jgi:hypothetical protein
MKNLKEAIRVKEEQVRVLMEQIDKLRAAVAILEEEANPLGMAVEPPTAAPKPEAGSAPVQKRAWP